MQSSQRDERKHTYILAFNLTPCLDDFYFCVKLENTEDFLPAHHKKMKNSVSEKENGNEKSSVLWATRWFEVRKKIELEDELPK